MKISKKLLHEIVRQIVEEKKRDRCLRIADRKYDKPSAYKSGAVVRCREGDIWKNLKEQSIHQKALSQTEVEALEMVHKDWDEFGGEECNNGFCDIFARNLSKFLPGSKIMSTEDTRGGTFGHVWVKYRDMYFDAETPDGVSSWKKLPWMLKFYSKNKSYPTDIEFLNEAESLHKWFNRKGAKGSSSGWVDCNTCRKDSKTGKISCKSCGRQKGEKRDKYPSCRPTPSKCKDKGKGKTWGKKK